MREIHVSQHFDAPIERVFAAASDHESFLAGPATRCLLQREGAPERNGIGAVREVRSAGLVFVEEITAFDAPRHFAYVIRSLSRASGRALPFRHQRGWLDLTPAGDGTRVDWHSRFEVPLPLLGRWVLEPLVARQVGLAFASMLRRAAIAMRAP